MLRLENNYKKFSDFCRRVLDPAMQELKELAEKGFCDCHFDYEKKYDHGQRGGEPDELIFIIHRTKDKMNVQLQEMTQNQRRQFQQYLVQYFDFTPVNAQAMAESYYSRNLPRGCTEANEPTRSFCKDILLRTKLPITFKSSLTKMLKIEGSSQHHSRGSGITYRNFPLRNRNLPIGYLKPNDYFCNRDIT